MGFYRRIDCRMWGDARFRQLSDPAKLLWVWLLTGPHTTSLPGLFPMGRAAASEAMDWTQGQFDKAFGEIEASGMIRADWNARVVWVPNVIQYNNPRSPDNIRPWAANFNLVPECALKTEAWQVLKLYADTKGDGFAKAYGETMPEPKGDPKPTLRVDLISEKGRHRDRDRDRDRDREEDSRAGSDEPAPDDARPAAPSADPGKKAGRLAGEIDAVCAHYLERMGKNPNQYKITPERRQCVARRLKDSDVTALKAAIDECARSDHHMGQNDGGKLYNDLVRHILKSDAKVEWWLEQRAHRMKGAGDGK